MIMESGTATASVRSSLLDTCDELTEQSTPNLLRLYLNPWVACACVAFDHFARPHLQCTAGTDVASFFANSTEEALSGAIKLARYHVNGREPAVRSGQTIIVDSHNRLPHFGYSVRSDGSTTQHVPGIVRCSRAALSATLEAHPTVGVVVFVDDLQDDRLAQSLHGHPDIMTIGLLGTTSFAATREASDCCDIVVYDESVVCHETAFAAFCARQPLLAAWWSGPMSMFHSTTFQPNAITTRHFIRSLRQTDPVAAELLQPRFQEILSSAEARHDVYRRQYSPSLSRLIRTTEFDQAEPTASGHTITIGDRRIFDGVAGVACSLRGHNPPELCFEVEARLAETTDLSAALSAALHRASGLPHHVPAVSGGSAVEQALMLGLMAQPQRPHVVALKGGFGGKTLGALTGTSRPKYKTNLAPLYEHVTYVDPFAATAVSDLQQAVRQHNVGVLQLELIQGVGGVRPLPEAVLAAVAELHEAEDFLLFVDEVQTGMYRTGPFLRSADVGLQPDLVTLGKGASDMMFPIGITLFNERVRAALADHPDDPIEYFRQRYFHPESAAALLNSLERAEKENWEQQVRHQGQVFAAHLQRALAGCRQVEDVRVFGMLTGVELRRQTRIYRLLGRTTARLYSLAMLTHRHPLLMGFCQYEPHVFKLTPGLLMADDEIAQVCTTIGESLRRSPVGVIWQGLRTILRTRRAESSSAADSAGERRS